MINYRSDEERNMAIYYARRFADGDLVRLLEEGVNTSQDARKLAEFFWRMVEQAGTDGKNNKPFCSDDRAVLESLMNVISGRLEKQGFEAEWDEAEDNA